MKYIDLDNWKRKQHFDFFHRMDYQQYNICMDVDVTSFLAFTRNHQLSFYYSMIYGVTAAVNNTEEFKYRIRDDKVILHETIHPSFTDMDKEDDLFKMVMVEMSDDIFSFEKRAKEISQKQHVYFDPNTLSGRDDVIYITCIPWISFTHISHTISLNRNDSVPRISWGKYFRQGSKTLLPFSVQVNHALVDGYHIGKYVEALQQYLNNID